MIIVSPRVKIKYFLCKRLRNIHLRAGIQPKNVSFHFFHLHPAHFCFMLFL